MRDMDSMTPKRDEEHVATVTGAVCPPNGTKVYLGTSNGDALRC